LNTVRKVSSEGKWTVRKVSSVRKQTVRKVSSDMVIDYPGCIGGYRHRRIPGVFRIACSCVSTGKNLCIFRLIAHKSSKIRPCIAPQIPAGTRIQTVRKVSAGQKIPHDDLPVGGERINFMRQIAVVCDTASVKTRKAPRNLRY